jgi:hypothetical protein
MAGFHRVKFATLQRVIPPQDELHLEFASGFEKMAQRKKKNANCAAGGKSFSMGE